MQLYLINPEHRRLPKGTGSRRSHFTTRVSVATVFGLRLLTTFVFLVDMNPINLIRKQAKRKQARADKG